MTSTFIQNIEFLHGLPMFPNFIHTTGLPQFRKHNLIYGFNGCGKTTLSRVFACLADSSRHHEWSDSCEYRVKLSDGSVATPSTGESGLSNRLLVFNEDFVSQHLRWAEREASPIFLHIGPEAKERQRNLQVKVAERATIVQKLEVVAEEVRSADREFSTHKRDRARLIEDATSQARQYNAARLARDYDDYVYDSSAILSENELRIQQDFQKQDEPLSPRDRLVGGLHSLQTLVADTRAIMGQTAGTVTIAVLRDHDVMLPWIKTGLKYHKEKRLESCLFCGNELAEDRISALESAIDDRYDQLVDDLFDAKRRAEELGKSLEDLKSSLPSRNDIVAEQRTKWDDATTSLRGAIGSGAAYIGTTIDLLERKSNTPNAAIVPDCIPTTEIASQWETSFLQCLEEINKIIDAHNKAHVEFDKNREAAKEKIRNHYLAEGHEEYRRLETRAKQAGYQKMKCEKERSEIESDIDFIKQQLQQHGPAAEQVNILIKRYLGHAELELAAKDEGYEIRRHGRVATAPPSEGEKTAIALCYFLILLESDGRRPETLIVVLDDPISSMDTRATNYACSMIRSLKSVGQLFVLTHNLHVMNNLKQWLKNQTERRVAERNRRENTNKHSPTGALFFIDTVQPSGAESRQSRLVEMPKHLREYEAEYHFLYNLMLRFLNCESDMANYFFVMPNCLRKILEVFLAFKMPGSDGLSSKVDDLARRAEQIGIDKDRLRALERLAHVESHGDSIDDLTTMSSMTVEETEDAAKALLELMQLMDLEHKNRMDDLCRT